MKITVDLADNRRICIEADGFTEAAVLTALDAVCAAAQPTPEPTLSFLGLTPAKPLLERTVIITPLAGGKAGGYFRALDADAFVQAARQPVTLIHEPTNPHDANAVQVFARLNDGLTMLGYLPTNLAAAVAATLADDGDKVIASLADVHRNGRRVTGIDIAIEISDFEEVPF